MKPTPKITLVDTEDQTIRAIRAFREEGYPLEHIYVLAHDSEQTKDLSRLTDTSTIGVMEEGVATAFANLFRSRGDQLRAKLQSFGVSEPEAARYESELDKGRIIVMAWHNTIKTDDTVWADSEEERNLTRSKHPEDVAIPPMGGIV